MRMSSLSGVASNSPSSSLKQVIFARLSSGLLLRTGLAVDLAALAPSLRSYLMPSFSNAGTTAASKSFQFASNS